MVIDMDSRRRSRLIRQVRQAYTVNDSAGREIILPVSTQEDIDFIRTVASSAGYRVLSTLGAGSGFCVMQRAG